MAGPLGRVAPQDWEHVERYGLAALPPAAAPVGVPVTIGVNWYQAFDRPEQVGNIWIVARDGNLGRVRGGHCVCVLSQHQLDTWRWWDFYNQGREGACVGFGSSRMMSLLNRKRYVARWLWDRAKELDGFDDTNPGDNNGTSVRAAMDVLRKRGHVPWTASTDGLDDVQRGRLQPVEREGIMENRWATTVDEVLEVLDSPLYVGTRQAVPFLNSWGRDYPRKVWMPLTVLERLLAEDGEVTMIVDR